MINDIPLDIWGEPIEEDLSDEQWMVREKLNEQVSRNSDERLREPQRG